MQVTLTFRILKGVFLSLMLAGSVSPGRANPTVLNFISEIKGDVRLKRSQWNGYQKANMGDLLNPSDQLQLGAGASATIMCNNLEVWVVPAKKVSLVSDGCGSGTPILTRPDQSRMPSRPAGLTEATLRKIPYIISPRDTSILNDRPTTLRWNAVSGATQYRVTVEDWEAETSNTEIVYTGELKKDPDYSYFVSVKADNGASSDLEGMDVFFKVLDDQTARTIVAAAEKIKQEGLSKEAEGLALAYLYRGNNLNAEAIELLEGLVKAGSQTTAFYQLLGDIYRQVGLNILAKERYVKALQLARNEGDVERQALAQAGLGEVEYAMGNGNDAVQWLEEAKTGYAVLGDQDQVQQLAKRINFFLGR